MVSSVEANPSPGRVVWDTWTRMAAGLRTWRTVKAHTMATIATTASTATQRGMPRMNRHPPRNERIITRARCLHHRGAEARRGTNSISQPRIYTDLHGFEEALRPVKESAQIR